MDIAIYTVSDDTGSEYLMSQDMSRYLSQYGTVRIGGKLDKDHLGRPDLLINMDPKSVIEIEKVKRFFWYGDCFTIFTPCTYAFTDTQVTYMLASAAKMPMVVHSPILAQEVFQRVREMFSPSLQRKLLSNIWHINYGVLPDYEAVRRPEARFNFVAPFTRCIETQKHYTEHRLLTLHLQDMIKTRHGVDTQHDLYYASQKYSHIDKVDTTGYRTFPLIKDRAEYKKRLLDYGFAISCSDYESFGLYYVELLLAGVIVVFVDHPWVRTLLPGYPFVAPKAEVEAMALHLFENYDAAFDQLEAYLPHVRSEYLIPEFVRKFWDFYMEKRNVAG
jgi:hypothetical protein